MAKKQSATPTKISELKFDDKNFNTGTPFGTQLLEKSIQEFGFREAATLDKNGVLIGGNKRMAKAGELGYENLEVIKGDPNKAYAIQYDDVDITTERGRKMALALNATAKANIVFDAELVEAELGEAVCEEWGIELPENIVEEDGFDAEPPLNPITVLGDVYELNQHRFSCGSSTEADVVVKTLDGAKPILMVTDPPYGVNYDASWRKKAGIKNCENNSEGKVTNDDNSDWKEAYSLFAGDVAYVWHSGRYAKTVAQNLEDCGLDIGYQIIWNKEQGVIGRGDYHFKHEPCWYAIRKGKKHNWQGSRKETTVWDINKANKKDTGHSTQKPIECMARPIRNNTFERESVYDPFLGSGTTLIAADQLNRACYGQEIDPAYCDIIVARFIKYKQSSATEFTIKRNGVQLSEKDIAKYLKQIEPKE